MHEDEDGFTTLVLRRHPLVNVTLRIRKLRRIERLTDLGGDRNGVADENRTEEPD